MTLFFTVSALLMSIAAVVLAFIFITPEKKRLTLSKFGKLLHDTLSFKFLIIEKVLQALYIFATAYSIVYGFFMLFYVQKSFYGTTRWYGGYGLLLMILGPIAIRLVYELLIMTVLLVKNVISINNKLANQNDGEDKNDIFAIPDLKGLKGAQAKAPVAAPVAPPAPAAETPAAPPAEAPAPAAAPDVCPNCGATDEKGTFCTKCGTKLK